MGLKASQSELHLSSNKLLQNIMALYQKKLMEGDCMHLFGLLST